MVRLLIGSCGGLTGIFLARQYKCFENLYVYGSDVNKNSAGKFFVKKLIYLPSADNPNFIHTLINILNKYNIDFYIPTHSHEIIKVSKYSELIKNETHTNFIVSPYKSYEALNRKDVAYSNLKKIGLHAPDVYKKCDDAVYPAFVKKIEGSGSNGIGLIKSEEEFNQILENDNSSFICQYLQGPEYTVDCLFDFNGHLLGYNQRRRVKFIGGAVSITTNDNPIDILPVIRCLSNSYKLCGCINFQYILYNSTPYIIDINLRFASGGLPLSVKSGVDVPKAYIKLLSGSCIKPGEYSSDFKPRTMYRYFEEIYDDRSI